MSGFSDQWLALREPADTAARGSGLLEELSDAVANRRLANADGEISVVDLGAGTGANFRHLAPHLGYRQKWCFVDQDETLRGPTQQRLVQWAQRVGATIDASSGGWHLSAADFSANVSLLTIDLSDHLDQLPWDSTDLITGSALLDLVSLSWVTELAGYCRRSRCLALFALTYDGRVEWRPPHTHDDTMAAAFNLHQQRDKGFGPALGAQAARASVDCFAANSYHVLESQSDWDLDGSAIELQRELLIGWARALGELASISPVLIAQWLDDRLSALDSDDAHLTVGHIDWLALPLPPLPVAR